MVCQRQDPGGREPKDNARTKSRADEIQQILKVPSEPEEPKSCKRKAYAKEGKEKQDVILVFGEGYRAKRFMGRFENRPAGFKEIEIRDAILDKSLAL